MNFKTLALSYKTNRIIVNSSIIFAMLFLSLFVPAFAIVAFVFTCLCLVFEFNEKVYYYLFFLFPFSGIFKYNFNQTSFFAFVIILALAVLALRYLIDKRYKNKETWLATGLTFLLLVYFAIPKNQINLTVLLNFGLVAGLVFFALLYKDKLDYKKIILFFVAGLVLSCLVSFLKFEVSRLEYLIPKTFKFQNGILRHTFLFNDPNYASVAVLMGLVGSAFLFLNKKIKYYIFYPIFIALTTLGIITSSKAFLLAYLFFVVILLVCFCFKKDWRHILLNILTVTVVLLSLFFIFKQRFEINYKRSFENFYDEEAGAEASLDAITTGRTAIWKNYLKHFLQNPVSLIFGEGTGAKGVKGAAAHNAYIELVYYVGIIGLVFVLCFAVYFFINVYKKHGRKFILSDFLPSLSLLLIIGALNFVAVQNFGFYLIIALLPFYQKVPQNLKIADKQNLKGRVVNEK